MKSSWQVATAAEAIAAALPACAPSEIVTRRQVRHHSWPTWPPDTGAPETSIVVPEDLRNPHKLVSEASRHIRGRKGPLLGHPLSRHRGRAGVSRASPADHACAHPCAREEGFEVEVTRPLIYEERNRREESEAPTNATRVKVSGEWIQLGTTEKRSAVRVPAPEAPRGLKGSGLDSWNRRNRARTDLVPTAPSFRKRASNWRRLESADDPRQRKDRTHEAAKSIPQYWADGANGQPQRNETNEELASSFQAHLMDISQNIRRRQLDISPS